MWPFLPYLAPGRRKANFYIIVLPVLQTVCNQSSDFPENERSQAFLQNDRSPDDQNQQ